LALARNGERRLRGSATIPHETFPTKRIIIIAASAPPQSEPVVAITRCAHAPRHTFVDQLDLLVNPLVECWLPLTFRTTITMASKKARPRLCHLNSYCTMRDSHGIDSRVLPEVRVTKNPSDRCTDSTRWEADRNRPYDNDPAGRSPFRPCKLPAVQALRSRLAHTEPMRKGSRSLRRAAKASTNHHCNAIDWGCHERGRFVTEMGRGLPHGFKNSRRAHCDGQRGGACWLRDDIDARLRRSRSASAPS
jgi:hypothetical protein